MWNGQKYHLVEGERVEELRDNEAIREATYRFAPIVSQTRISSQETGLSAIIECPIKTMNTNRGGDLYQVDTGPVAFPDLGGGYERHVDRISLAFLAFNAPDFTDFVIEAPTLVGEGERAGEDPPLLQTDVAAGGEPAVLGGVAGGRQRLKLRQKADFAWINSWYSCLGCKALVRPIRAAESQRSRRGGPRRVHPQRAATLKL